MNRLSGIKEDGTPFLMLILEPANINRMELGDPIKVQVEEMFPNGIPASLEVMVAFSETPMADASEFVKLAKTSTDERTPVLKAQRPHCPECKSTIEQIAKFGQAGFPVTLLFCPVCGCVLGIHYDTPPKPALYIGQEGLPQREM